MALISALTDTFTGATLGPLWEASTFGAISAVSIDAGRCKMVAGTEAYANATVTSVVSYDHTNGSSFMQIESFGGQPTGWHVRLMVGSSDNDLARFTVNASALSAQIYNGGTEVFSAATVAYNAVNHKWLRIRHQSSDDTLHFETSPNGSSWTDHYNSSAHTWGVTALLAAFQVQVEAASTAPGLVVYVDNFNIPGGTVGVLADDFTAPTLNAQWDPSVSGAISAVSIDTGRLKLVAGTAANALASIISVAARDHTNNSSWFEIDSFGNQPTGWHVRLLVGLDDNNILRFAVNAGTLAADIYNGGVQAFSAQSVTYNPLIHKWLRARHQSSDDTWHFETSADGAAWTDHYNSSAHTWGVTALLSGVEAQTLSVNTAPGLVAYVDNFNIAGTPAPAEDNPVGFFFRHSGGGGATITPPDPGGEGVLISSLLDLSSAWTPTHVTPAAVNSHFKQISTPSGPGWEMICDDNDVTPWDNTNRAILARKDPTVNNIGTTELYTFNLFFPTQTLYNIWHTGLLFELHTDTSSGHHFSCDMQTGTPRFRIGRNLDGYNYAYTYTSNIVFNTWIPVRIEIKWSTTSTGFYKFDIGGVRYVDYAGATAFAGNTVPYLQFGWYSRRGSGLTNTVRFGNMRKLVT